jgi:hypothetical protein
MSNEFDLERAKAGEPVEFIGVHGPFPVEFIGNWSGDVVVCRFALNENPALVNTIHLRMAPKTVKVRYRNYILKDSVHLCVSMIADAPGYETPEGIEKKSWFKGWIHTEWQEAAVPQ